LAHGFFCPFRTLRARELHGHGNVIFLSFLRARRRILFPIDDNTKERGVSYG
jgi:hypothetical protein